MNTTQQGIITLLKSAVLQQPFALPDGFDLEAAMELIRLHGIGTLAYDGAVRCGIPRSDPQMKVLFQQYCRALQVSERQLLELDRIYGAFQKNGIAFLPLKGCIMKQLYPKPELRHMGDADILIRLDQNGQITPIMEQLGFTFKEQTDHEIVWLSQGLYLELHKRLIPSYNRDISPYFGDGWQRAIQSEGTRFEMSPEDTFIFLFTHYAKHFRDGGIGCRHVLDLWIYQRSHPELDLDYVRAELGKLELLTFFENTCRLIAAWFGEAEGDATTERMQEYVFDSGSYGKDESRALSRAVRDSRHSVLGFSGRLLYLWQTAFPDVATLRGKYTVLKKHPYLLPLIWLVRPFYKLLFEFKTLRRQKNNLSALSQENLDERQKMLQDVGLEYRF